MLTFVLLTGRQPFSSPKTDDPMVVMRRIVDDAFVVKFPPYVSPAARDFVMALLERKPTRRLGMLQVPAAGAGVGDPAVGWGGAWVVRLVLESGGE